MAKAFWLVLVILASLSIAGCTINTNSPTATPAPTQDTLQVSPTTMPTISVPTPTPVPNFSSILNSNTGWLGQGYVITTPFVKTTHNGRTCYAGELTRTGYVLKCWIYPMNSYGEAAGYREQLISNYKAQGYTTYEVLPSSSGSAFGNSDTSITWIGAYGNNAVGIGALQTSVIDSPVTVELLIPNIT